MLKASRSRILDVSLKSKVRMAQIDNAGRKVSRTSDFATFQKGSVKGASEHEHPRSHDTTVGSRREMGVSSHITSMMFPGGAKGGF